MPLLFLLGYRINATWSVAHSSASLTTTSPSSVGARLSKATNILSPSTHEQHIMWPQPGTSLTHLIIYQPHSFAFILTDLALKSSCPRHHTHLSHAHPCALFLFRFSIGQATLRMVTPPSSPTSTPVPASTAASARSPPPLVPLLDSPLYLFIY